jgi:hypothetical protein
MPAIDANIVPLLRSLQPTTIFSKSRSTIAVFPGPGKRTESGEAEEGFDFDLQFLDRALQPERQYRTVPDERRWERPAPSGAGVADAEYSPSRPNGL